MAIIAVVTGLVLAKYVSFDSTVLLKSEAYEMALLLREAQIKSVSVAQAAGGNFEYPYGVSFTPGSNEYIGFMYASNDAPYPYYEGNPNAVGISTSTMDRTMRVDVVCIIIPDGGSSTEEVCSDTDPSITSLSVSFRRPEFKALMHAVGYGGDQGEILGAKIRIGSGAGGPTQFVVEVTKLGQVSIYKY